MTSRRVFLNRIGHTVLSASGISALMLTAHALMKPHSGRYPQGRRSPNRPGLGVSLSAEQGQRLIRPPGALDEKAFMAGCIRCQRCQDACDVGAIQYFSQSQGELAHTPVYRSICQGLQFVPEMYAGLSHGCAASHGR